MAASLTNRDHVTIKRQIHYSDWIKQNETSQSNNKESGKTTSVSSNCEEILKQKEDEIILLRTTNEKLLRNKQTIYCELEKVEEKASELQNALQSLSRMKEDTRPEQSLKKNADSTPSGDPELKQFQKRTDNVHDYATNAFIKRMIDFEEKTEKEKEELKTENQKLTRQNNDLRARLNTIDGEKCVDSNPATSIAELSDSNRPTKLGELYSEIYDNEWTNAFEALVESGYDEITAVETLRLTLQNVLQFCESKASLMFKKASDAVNLVSEEYQHSDFERAGDVGQRLRQKSSLEDMKLQRMWQPKSNTRNKTDGAEMCSEKVQTEEQTELDADKILMQLRKDMATYMVPIVQKAYVEASWTNGCIDDLKPYILKCLYVGWMMVVQSPPMVLHTFPCERDIKFDKNLYKEYTASGLFVRYVVWPALLLEENGSVVCKGVAEGKKLVH